MNFQALCLEENALFQIIKRSKKDDFNLNLKIRCIIFLSFMHMLILFLMTEVLMCEIES